MSRSNGKNALDLSAWPFVVVPMLVTICLGAVMNETQTLVELWRTSHLATNSRLGLVVEVALVAGLSALAALVALSAKWQGLYCAVLASITTSLLRLHFRGAWITPGTFDLWNYPLQDGTWAWAAIGVAAGLAIGAIPSMRSAVTHCLKKHWSVLALASALAVMALGLVSLAQTSLMKLGAWSLFPPTRHVGLIVLGATMLVVALTSRQTAKGQEATI